MNVRGRNTIHYTPKILKNYSKVRLVYKNYHYKTCIHGEESLKKKKKKRFLPNFDETFNLKLK